MNVMSLTCYILISCTLWDLHTPVTLEHLERSGMAYGISLWKIALFTVIHALLLMCAVIFSLDITGRIHSEAKCTTMISCPQVQEANDSILNSALIAGVVVLFLQPVAAYSINGMYTFTKYYLILLFIFTPAHLTRKPGKLVGRGALCQLLSSVMCAITSLGAVIVILLDMDFISGCCMELSHRHRTV